MTIADPDISFASRLNLPPDDVQLWKLDLAALAIAEQRWSAVLSLDESARARRFRFAKDRQYFTATRALLRMLLGSYVGADPKELIFDYSEKQKPALRPQDFESVDFSVSHSGDLALLAFARDRPVGVDIERLRLDFDFDALAQRYFSEREQQELATLDSAQRSVTFFRVWTRKEAYLKALGLGLSLPLSEFDVPLDRAEKITPSPSRHVSGSAAWTWRDVEVGPQYIASVCAKGECYTLRF